MKILTLFFITTVFSCKFSDSIELKFKFYEDVLSQMDVSNTKRVHHILRSIEAYTQIQKRYLSTPRYKSKEERILTLIETLTESFNQKLAFKISESFNAELDESEIEDDETAPLLIKPKKKSRFKKFFRKR